MIISLHRSGRRTDHRCIYTCENAEPKDQSDRCGTGRSDKYDCCNRSRTYRNTSKCQHDRRWYSSKKVGEQNLPYVMENVDQIVTVEDDELVGAFLDMVENHKMVVENSGLLSVAALKQLDLKGKKVVSILSTGTWMLLPCLQLYSTD